MTHNWGIPLRFSVITSRLLILRHTGRYALVNCLALALTGLLVQCGGGTTPIAVPAPSQPVITSGLREATIQVGKASIAMVQVPAGRFRARVFQVGIVRRVRSMR